MNSSVYGKKMAKLRKQEVKIVNGVKKYIKLASRPSFNYLAAI